MTYTDHQGTVQNIASINDATLASGGGGDAAALMGPPMAGWWSW